MGVVSAFAQTLRRYTSLNHLAQAARAVLQNTSQINQMLSDLNRVDFANVQVTPPRRAPGSAGRRARAACVCPPHSLTRSPEMQHVANPARTFLRVNQIRGRPPRGPGRHSVISQVTLAPRSWHRGFGSFSPNVCLPVATVTALSLGLEGRGRRQAGAAARSVSAKQTRSKSDH